MTAEATIYQERFGYTGNIRRTENIPYPEGLKIGQSAAEVFCQIVKLNPRIAAFSFKTYNPDLSSETPIDAVNESQQAPVFHPREYATVDRLAGISLFNYSSAGGHNGIAICSTVITTGNERAHLKMIDFKAEPDEATTQEIVESMGSGFGVVLKTEHSYHFWGTSLLTPPIWYDTMKNYQRFEQKRGNKGQPVLFDPGFLEHSLNSGHSALRIFAYGSSHKDIPKVVALVN